MDATAHGTRRLSKAPLLRQVWKYMSPDSPEFAPFPRLLADPLLRILVPGRQLLEPLTLILSINKQHNGDGSRTH